MTNIDVKKFIPGGQFLLLPLFISVRMHLCMDGYADLLHVQIKQQTLMLKNVFQEDNF